MASVDIDADVFNSIYIPQLKNTSRLQILYGGSSSGKSAFKAQQVVYDLLQGGRNYLICRQVGRTLRGSVVQEVTKVIKKWNLLSLFEINKTDGTITCSNGYQALFAGLDDVEKLKSITPAKGVITDIWVEEATEIEQASLKQLIKRQRGGSEKILKRIHLTFNPIIKQHWIYQTYFIGWADEQKKLETPDLSILKTTYKDNRFLTASDVADLEREQDSYYYQVYTLGNWGVLGNVIFTNWKVEDLSEMKAQFTNVRNGLDFGFSTDPAAISISHYDRMRKIIYFYDELYETGLTNDVLAERVLNIIGGDTVTCDSSEPKSIVELQNSGVYARGAVKGKDSVVHGIQWLQQHQIVVDIKCINMQNELQLYKWKEDAGGTVVRSGGLPVPLDKNNHLIDATRYAYEGDMTDNWLIS